ncbi:MAG TPA: hypothetical protein VEA92_01665 [Candidatus Paceibacterota bacterium]|nr:hypothetical protein [Candidatus Paceibacterota bacterium]
MESATMLATTTAASALSLVGNIFVFLLIVAALVVFAMRVGKAALLSLILSLYIGYALYSVFPFTDIAGGTPVANVVVYGVFVILSYLLVRRISGGGMGSFKIVPLIILCALAGGFVMALGYTALNIDTVYDFPKTLDLLFAPKEYFFWWFMAPLAAAFFVSR